MANVSLSYDLKKQEGNIITICCPEGELMAELVHTDMQSGRLILKNIRCFDKDTGNLQVHFHSLADGSEINIGLAQNKVFWEPSFTAMSKYNAIFPPA